MKCSCCNKRLSDYETTLKHAVTGAYLDTCLDCLSEISHDVHIPVKARKDLVHELDVNDNDDYAQMTVEYNSYFKGNIEDKDNY